MVDCGGWYGDDMAVSMYGENILVAPPYVLIQIYPCDLILAHLTGFMISGLTEVATDVQSAVKSSLLRSRRILLECQQK